MRPMMRIESSLMRPLMKVQYSNRKLQNEQNVQCTHIYVENPNTGENHGKTRLHYTVDIHWRRLQHSCTSVSATQGSWRLLLLNTTMASLAHSSHTLLQHTSTLTTFCSPIYSMFSLYVLILIHNTDYLQV